MYPNMNEVCQGLFIGNILAAEDSEMLNKNNIKIVVTLLSPEDVKTMKQVNGVEYIIFEIEDGSGDIISIGQKVSQIIRSNSNVNILVHCALGVSRSSSVVIFHLMTLDEKRNTANQKYRHAYKLLKLRRKIIQPHFSYKANLINFFSTI